MYRPQFNKMVLFGKALTLALSQRERGLIRGSFQRERGLYFGLLLIILSLVCGCSWWDGNIMRSQSPDESPPPEKPQHQTKLVGDYAVPFGLYPVRVEAVGLVTGLNGTGSDPALRRGGRHCSLKCKPGALPRRITSWPPAKPRW